jgi:glutathione S-transferase
MKIKLISFPICPYVHRCAITLKFKNVDYDIEYINLKNKPAWFLNISPLGKVPVMIVNNKEIIFESSVINELIDELFGERTLSTNPIEKAKERAWIEFASSCFAEFYQVVNSQEYEKSFKALLNKLQCLEEKISDAGFFKNSGFSIIDSSYAPLFFRLKYIDSLWYHPDFMALNRVHAWANNLAGLSYVKTSVREDFTELFTQLLTEKNPNLLPKVYGI